MSYAIAAAAVIAVGSAGYGAYAQDKAQDKQKKANKKAERIEALQAQRARVKAIRDNRVAQAQVLALAGNEGVQGSSGVQGTIASLGTQQAENIGFANQIDQLYKQRLNLLSGANKQQVNAGYAAQVGSLATTYIGAQGGK